MRYIRTYYYYYYYANQFRSHSLLSVLNFNYIVSTIVLKYRRLKTSFMHYTNEFSTFSNDLNN